MFEERVRQTFRQTDKLSDVEVSEQAHIICNHILKKSSILIANLLRISLLCPPNFSKIIELQHFFAFKS